MRAAVFVVVFAVWALLGDLEIRLLRIFCGGPAFRARLQQQHVRLARRILRLARTLTGLRLTIESAIVGPLPPAALVLCNHQSLIDIAAVFLALPDHLLRFVAKAELGSRIPLVAPALRYGRHAVIRRRGRFEQTRAALLGLARQQGVAPVIFPEGTRSRDGSLGPYHSAAVRVLVEACRLPVLAVAVEGGDRLRTFSQINRIGDVHYRVKLLSVHPSPSGRDGALRLLAQVRGDVAAQLVRWRG